MRMLASILVQPRQRLIAAGVVVSGLIVFGVRSCRSSAPASELSAAVERHLDSAAGVVRTVQHEVTAARRAAGQERAAYRRVAAGRRVAGSLKARADSLAGVATAEGDTARGWRAAYVVRDSEAEVLRGVLGVGATVLGAANLRAKLLGDAAAQSFAAIQGSDSLLRVSLTEVRRRCRVLGVLPCVSRRVVIVGVIGAAVVLRGLARAPL